MDEDKYRKLISGTAFTMSNLQNEKARLEKVIDRDKGRKDLTQEAMKLRLINERIKVVEAEEKRSEKGTPKERMERLRRNR